jgi:hypothetical protein
MANCKHLHILTFQDESTRVNFNAEPAAYHFFVRQVFAGERGAIASIMNQLLTALHKEAVAQGISPAWDPDGKNQKQIQTLLDNVKFTRSGRTINRPTKRKQKPTAGHSN